MVLPDIDLILSNDKIIRKPKEFLPLMDEKDSKVINMDKIGLHFS